MKIPKAMFSTLWILLLHGLAEVCSLTTPHVGLSPPKTQHAARISRRQLRLLPTSAGSTTVLHRAHHASSSTERTFLQKGSALARVMSRILLVSLQPRMWRSHLKKTSKFALFFMVVSVCFHQKLSAGILLQACFGAGLLRCYLLPAIYGSLMVFAWPMLCHGRHPRRVLHEAYILTAWWFSNKLLTDRDEARVPGFLRSLGADAQTVQLARSFVKSRRGGLNISDPTELAHSSGTLALYRHSFGSDVLESPDWQHVVMHCCYGRILDDYQDVEEDRRDGNDNRNFFLVQKPDNEEAVVVQAMRGMQWHQTQILDPLVRQYAEGATKALQVCMSFKTGTFKRVWNNAQAKAALREADSAFPSPLADFDWPFCPLGRE